MQKIQLGIFPFMEILCSILGLIYLKYSIFFSVITIVLAAFCLNFSLHITYHYQVHFKLKIGIFDHAIEIFYSLLMGIPFQYYQMSHWNHHKYNNNLEDFTTTWKLRDKQLRPINILHYSLFWPLGSLQFLKQLKQSKKEKIIRNKGVVRMMIEELFILLFSLVLFKINVAYLLMYVFMIYLGWVFIALHNYGQHVPMHYGKQKGYSYYNKIYNSLFVLNGFHMEHHNNPNIRYWLLEKDDKSEVVTHAHLIAGFFFEHKANENEQE